MMGINQHIYIDQVKTCAEDILTMSIVRGLFSHHAFYITFEYCRKGAPISCRNCKISLYDWNIPVS